jgi:hypothetical protein
MEKLKFWAMVGLTSMIFIYLAKGLAAQSNIPSLQKFTQAI